MHLASLMQPFSALSDPLQQHGWHGSHMRTHARILAQTVQTSTLQPHCGPTLGQPRTIPLPGESGAALVERGARVVAGADEGALAAAARGRRLLLLLLLLLLLWRLLGLRRGLVKLTRAGGTATVGPRLGRGTAVGARLRRPVLPWRPGACPLPCRSAALQCFSWGWAAIASQCWRLSWRTSGHLDTYFLPLQRICRQHLV